MPLGPGGLCYEVRPDLPLLKVHQLPPRTADSPRLKGVGRYFNTCQLGVVITCQLGVLNTCQLGVLNTFKLGVLNTCQVSVLNTCQLGVLNTCQLVVLNTCQLGVLNTCKLGVLNTCKLGLVIACQDRTLFMLLYKAYCLSKCPKCLKKIKQQKLKQHRL